MKNVYFLVILLAGVLFVVAAGINADELYGTKTWPVTYEMLEVIGGTFGLFILIVITFYSGELVWRERDAGLALIFDALPIPRWVVFTSKLVALLLVQVVLLGVLLAASLLLQVAKGYFHFELDVYVETLFGVRLVELLDPLLLDLAMLVHVVANNKYVGHVIAMILYFIAGDPPCRSLGFEHRLYRLGSACRRWKYSAMNGFGHFALPIAAFEALLGGAGRRLRDRRERAMGARDGDTARQSASVARLGQLRSRGMAFAAWALLTSLVVFVGAAAGVHLLEHRTS